MTGRVHVVVLNWNNEADSAECLDSFIAQRGVEVELLLVDNASSDGSGPRLHDRHPAVDYLQTAQNLGYAGGNNAGIARALEKGAEWVLVVNNDTVAAPDCVRLLLDAARADPRLAAVAPLITRYDRPSDVWFAGGTLSMTRAMGVHHAGRGLALPERGAGVPSGTLEGGKAVECGFVSGCCLLLRAEALRAVGLFREDFFAYVEDVEFCYRLRRAGWKLGWIPQSRLAHKVPPPGSPPTAAQIRLRDRNRRRMVDDLWPPHWRAAFALWFWPTRAIHLARYLLAGDSERARAMVAGMTER